MVIDKVLRFLLLLIVLLLAAHLCVQFFFPVRRYDHLFGGAVFDTNTGTVYALDEKTNKVAVWNIVERAKKQTVHKP